MRVEQLRRALGAFAAAIALFAVGCDDGPKKPATGAIDGKCFENGSCNDGLECIENVCTAVEPVGTLGGRCYGNGDCNEGLICVEDVCQADSNPTPPDGTLDGDCFDNGTCNPGLICVDATCAADTGPGTGDAGGRCLANGTCNAGLTCGMATSQDGATPTCVVPEPIELGVLNAPCYENLTCNGGLICQRGTCVDELTAIVNPDGTEGGLCYANGSCDDGLVCDGKSLCVDPPDGTLGGDCLEGGLCDLGLVCKARDTDGNGVPDAEPSTNPAVAVLNPSMSCQIADRRLGSIHGVVTDAVTNARLPNVTVTTVHLGEVITATTDALGYYEFDNLNPGHYELAFEPDGGHTVTRFTGGGEIVIDCPDPETIGTTADENERDCNIEQDLEVYPFNATITGQVFYTQDGIRTPADGVTIVADYSDIVDIQPDRFTVTTDANGVYTFTGIPNTLGDGVNLYVMPATFNGIPYDSTPVPGNPQALDVFVVSPADTVMQTARNPPVLVSNNFQDFAEGGFPVDGNVVMTFSRAMNTNSCVPGLDGASVDATWSNGDTTLTLDPIEVLDTDTEYTIQGVGCEAAGDDQTFNLATAGGDSFTTQAGIRLLGTNAQPDFLTAVFDEFPIDGDITLTFDMDVDATNPDMVVELYQDGSDFAAPFDNDLLLDATVTVSGRVVTINPAADLDRGGNYYVEFEVFSNIEGDSLDEVEAFDDMGGTFEFQAIEEDDFFLVSHNIPSVDVGVYELPLSDIGQNIEITFNKEVDLVASSIRLEEANGDATDGFVVDATLTISAADNRIVVINPAADLTPGDTYRVHFIDVFPTDGQGNIEGEEFTFDVLESDPAIAFEAHNLQNPVNYENAVRLDFTAEVNPDEGFVVIEDEDGDIVYEETGVGGLSVTAHPSDGDDRRIEFAVLGVLEPDSNYTLRFKVFAKDSDVFYAQGEVAFTTEDHITLLSSNISTYDVVADTWEDGEDIAVDVDPSVTFTVAVDTSTFHPNNYVRLYDDNNNQIATTVTVSGATVTLSPLGGDLLPDQDYHVRYQVTSAIVLTFNDGSTKEDESEAATLSFHTAPVSAVDPVAPTTAPGSFQVVPGTDVDYDMTTFPLQWNHVVGADIYQLFARDAANPFFVQVGSVATSTGAGDGIDAGDTSLPNPFLYNWNSAIDNDVFDVGDGPVSEGNAVDLQVRACNDDGCGPLTATVQIDDNKGPEVVSFGIGGGSPVGSFDNSGGGVAVSPELDVDFSEPMDSSVLPTLVFTNPGGTTDLAGPCTFVWTDADLGEGTFTCTVPATTDATNGGAREVEVVGAADRAGNSIDTGFNEQIFVP